MTDENYEARAQAHLASIKRDMKASMEDAAVRAMHKVMAEFEAKSDERLMEDWGPGPHECHSLPARGAEQPAQRCPLCNYQHGHAIGCKNNPVDIALNKMAKNARELGLDYEQPAQQEPGRNHWEDGDVFERIAASKKQPAQQEPVAAECKFEGTKEWVRCSVEHHNLVQSEPHKWPDYQTRLLYTSPPARQEPAFHGFMDEERCCVNICYTPWAPGGPNNELPTAYYTSPPAQRPHECSRSHPHENMDAMCELRTEIARLTNENARLKAQPQQEPFGYLYEGTAEHTRHKTVFEKTRAERFETRWWREIGPCYTSPPAQRKPLTHEQRVDLLAKFEAHKHEWHAPAILIDMVEAAHGIKERP